MAYEQKPNSGSVFNNDRKETDNHPDRQGSALIECPHCNATFGMWLSGWIKSSDSKGNWLSLAFKPKEAKPAGRASPPPPSRPAGNSSTSQRATNLRRDMDDEIPF